jgi:hypothetical protein
MTGNAPEPTRASCRDRTPTPLLLALLRACSFRLVNDAVAWLLPLCRCELGSCASLLPHSIILSVAEPLRFSSPTSQSKLHLRPSVERHRETSSIQASIQFHTGKLVVKLPEDAQKQEGIFDWSNQQGDSLGFSPDLNPGPGLFHLKAHRVAPAA